MASQRFEAVERNGRTDDSPNASTRIASLPETHTPETEAIFDAYARRRQFLAVGHSIPPDPNATRLNLHAGDVLFVDDNGVRPYVEPPPFQAHPPKLREIARNTSLRRCEGTTGQASKRDRKKLRAYKNYPRTRRRGQR